MVPKARLPEIITSLFSSLSSPDSETAPNELVLVGHGFTSYFDRLHEMKISKMHIACAIMSLRSSHLSIQTEIPHNTFIIDTAVYEKQLFTKGMRSNMLDPTGKPRSQGSTLSLENLLLSLNIEIRCNMNNAGNDAYLCLLALQQLLNPENASTPTLRGPMAGTTNLNMGSSIARVLTPNGLPMMLNLSPSFPVSFTEMYPTTPRISPVTPVIGSTPLPGLSSRDPHASKSGYFDGTGHLYPGRRRQVSGNSTRAEGKGKPATSRRNSLNPEAMLSESTQAATLR